MTCMHRLHTIMYNILCSQKNFTIEAVVGTSKKSLDNVRDWGDTRSFHFIRLVVSYRVPRIGEVYKQLPFFNSS